MKFTAITLLFAASTFTVTAPLALATLSFTDESAWLDQVSGSPIHTEGFNEVTGNNAQIYYGNNPYASSGIAGLTIQSESWTGRVTNNRNWGGGGYGDDFDGGFWLDAVSKYPRSTHFTFDIPVAGFAGHFDTGVGNAYQGLLATITDSHGNESTYSIDTGFYGFYDADGIESFVLGIDSGPKWYGQYAVDNVQVTYVVAPVPEPSTVITFLTFAMVGLARRRALFGLGRHIVARLRK